MYGAKEWAIYPPHHQIMSNKQILHYFETGRQHSRISYPRFALPHRQRIFFPFSLSLSMVVRPCTWTWIDMLDFEARGVRAHKCVQTAGDVMIIPESWGHGVLNIQVFPPPSLGSVSIDEILELHLFVTCSSLML